MARTIIEGNGVISLGAIHGKEDLKPRPGININAPPADGSCDCCGKPLKELKPFGKAGDPLVGDFSGALLVKKWRWMAPPDEEVNRIMDRFFGRDPTKDEYERAKRRLIKEYGREEAERLELHHSLSTTTSSSWECRDCAVLDVYEYFEIRKKRYEEESSSSLEAQTVL